MPVNPFKFEVVAAPTEHISFGGKRVRRATVLIRVGKLSLSRKAFLLGVGLILCQILDGVLTYIGLSLRGVHMEANVFLRELMLAYGTAPTLLIVKTLALIAVGVLTLQAHSRRWIRPLILAMIGIYVILAVIPWVYIISRPH